MLKLLILLVVVYVLDLIMETSLPIGPVFRITAMLFVYLFGGILFIATLESDNYEVGDNVLMFALCWLALSILIICHNFVEETKYVYNKFLRKEQ